MKILNTIFYGIVAVIICGCTPDRLSTHESKMVLGTACDDNEIWAFEEVYYYKLIHPCEFMNHDTYVTRKELNVLKFNCDHNEFKKYSNIELELDGGYRFCKKIGNNLHLLKGNRNSLCSILLNMETGSIVGRIDLSQYRQGVLSDNSNKIVMTTSGKSVAVNNGVLRIFDINNKLEFSVDAFSSSATPDCADELSDGSTVFSINSLSSDRTLIKRINASKELLDAYTLSPQDRILGIIAAGDKAFTLVYQANYSSSNMDFLIYDIAGKILAKSSLVSKDLIISSPICSVKKYNGSALSFLVVGNRVNSGDLPFVKLIFMNGVLSIEKTNISNHGLTSR